MQEQRTPADRKKPENYIATLLHTLLSRQSANANIPLQCVFLYTNTYNNFLNLGESSLVS